MSSCERILIFGRLPEPGRTKTRLEPALGPEGAAALYQAFLDDLIASHGWVAERELWVPSRPAAEPILTARYPGWRVRLQPEGDLGVRLASAFDCAFSDSVDCAVALGSDHPTLPGDYMHRAFRALRGAHLVLGPTCDGGYYAIGFQRACWPRARGLFDGAPWSHPELLGWSRARASELGLCHEELPAWYDVDTPGDLPRLKADVSPGSATSKLLSELSLPSNMEVGTG